MKTALYQLQSRAKVTNGTVTKTPQATPNQATAWEQTSGTPQLVLAFSEIFIPQKFSMKYNHISVVRNQD